MRVQITEILFDEQLEAYQVSIATPFGTAYGKWNGDPPEMYAYYDVEIEAGPVLEWGESIAETAEERPLLDGVGETLTIQGQLEAVESSGIVYLRLGSSLISLETEGEPPPLDVYVRAHPDLILLFPREPLAD